MDIQRLRRTGFLPAKLEDQPGEAWVKQQPIEALPYAREHIVDEDRVWEGMAAFTEVTARGDVRLRIPAADYLEGPYPWGTHEAAALLADAGLSAG